MAKSRSSHISSANRPPPNADENFLLAALPAADYARIVLPLEVVPLKLKHVLHQPGKPIRDIYFPSDGFCSELTVLADGRMVEVATIGREGAVGLLGDAGNGPVSSATMVQAAMSTSVKMPWEAFQREMDQRGAFFDVLSRYRLALVRFIMQSTACNAHYLPSRPRHHRRPRTTRGGRVRVLRNHRGARRESDSECQARRVAMARFCSIRE